jgi:phenylacetic acid degradation operon negative regulatory protein
MRAALLAEEVLLLLEYGFDSVTNPRWGRWAPAYEEWLSANGLLARQHYLEAQKFLEQQRREHDWVYRLTAKGRLLVAGGRDPVAAWERGWDGWWRQLIFDLPEREHRARVALLRWLRRQQFGYLQDSVWITPDPVKDLAAAVRGWSANASLMAMLECRSAPGFGAADLVTAAWPFAAINQAYSLYEQFVVDALRRVRTAPPTPPGLVLLLREERERWLAAVTRDPLLPAALLPGGYRGRVAWQTRGRLLTTLAGLAIGQK